MPIGAVNYVFVHTRKIAPSDEALNVGLKGRRPECRVSQFIWKFIYLPSKRGYRNFFKPVIRLNRLSESSGAPNRPNFENQAIPEQGVVFIWDDENK